MNKKRVYISASFALYLSLQYDFWCTGNDGLDYYIDDSNDVSVTFLVIGKDYAYIKVL